MLLKQNFTHKLRSYKMTTRIPSKKSKFIKMQKQYSTKEKRY